MICERCGKTSFNNVLFCEHCGERRFKAKLRIVDRSGRDNTLCLFTQEYIVGREKSCDIHLDDDAVSRKHARLYYDRGSFYLQDLHSKNGLYVNGEKIEVCQLGNLDYVQIGGATLHFYYGEGDFPEDRLSLQTGEFIRETLLKISQEIKNKNMLDEVLTAIFDGLVAVTRAQEGTLFLLNESGELERKFDRNLQVFDEQSPTGTRISEIAKMIVENQNHYALLFSGKGRFFENLREACEFNCKILALALRSRRLGGFKLTEKNILGTAFLRLPQTANKLDEKKVSLLESLLSQAVVAIENSFLYNEALVKRRIDNELEVARQIQNRLLPRKIAAIPNAQIAAYSKAHGYVGGDYYDVLPIGEEACALAMADISGKGIGAALMMSSLQGSLRAQISYENRPEQIVEHINRIFRESSLDNLFATFFFGIYAYPQRTLCYVNAGHNPPLVLKQGGEAIHLKSSAAPLGILEKNHGEEQTVQLGQGDVVLFYTDGLTEAMNTEIKQLGLPAIKDFLKKVIAEQPGATAQSLLDQLLAMVAAHVGRQPQHDDLTILLLKLT